MNTFGDLFDYQVREENSAESRPAPLAHRMRPTSLDQYVGHLKVLGPGKPLRHWIESDRVPSLIFWGPPGCGKTTLARIIATQTASKFEQISAVTGGVKDIKECAAQAARTWDLHRRKTVLFVDEIHRFNRSQQDALLPFVEDGTLTLIGATTENPSFELNMALLSRCRVIRLERIAHEEIARLLERALNDQTLGVGKFLKLTSQAIDFLASVSEGDARRALTQLETIALFAGTQGSEPLTVEQVKLALESSMARQPIPYDKAGEEHYNVISAFIKSMREGDPHAGLYYLARMLEGGEDPLFIARRLVIFASEDVGNADPRALQIAIQVQQAVDFVGLPEARINLAQGVTYLAMAPKSRASYDGLNEAMEEVVKSGALPVPMHLRNAVTSLMKSEGYGQGYRKSHLPSEIVGKRFYHPIDAGLEIQIKEKLDRMNPDFD